MVQIPIVSGIYADTSPDYRTSYPLNMVPIPKVTGVSQGYLRTAAGIVSEGAGPGVARGGIEWNGLCYRVMGSKLVTVAVNGTIKTIGDVGAGGPVSMTYSFDYLAIASGGDLWLYDGTSLAQNVDPDLGNVLDVVWVDGYFMTTDGEFLVVTELGDPFTVNPLKYGSAEVDPDAVNAVVNMRGEIYAVNRNTIEVYSNVGGDFFPFQVVGGAQLFRGAVGTHAVAVFMESLAFVGSGRNEAPAVWLASGSGSQKISTREIDTILKEYTAAELAAVVVEAIADDGREVLHIHLPDRTLCFDGRGTQAIGQPIWYILSSSVTGSGAYRARYPVWLYGKWMVADSETPNVGHMDTTIATHWGDAVRWEFSTPIVYNEGRGAIFHALELVALTGSTVFGDSAFVSLDYSDDGVTWSQARRLGLGGTGDRGRAVKWARLGSMRRVRTMRFRGDSNAPISVARLEATMEPLAW